MILSVYRNYAILKNRNNRVAGWLASILHRMGVVLMKHFDFKDLMAFGMFIRIADIRIYVYQIVL